MATLFYFKDKVHRKRLTRSAKFLLLLLHLLCTILERIGFVTNPGLEVRHFTREVMTLSRWQHVAYSKGGTGSSSHTTSTQHQYVPPPRLHSEFNLDAPNSPPRPQAPTPSPPVQATPTTHLEAPSTSQSTLGAQSSTTPATITVSTIEFYSLMSTVQSIQATRHSSCSR